MLMNAHHEAIDFKLPKAPAGGTWQRIVNTDDIENPFAEEVVRENINLAGRSIVLLKEIPKQPRSAKQSR
jgi:isoamylase